MKGPSSILECLLLLEKSLILEEVKAFYELLVHNQSVYQNRFMACSMQATALTYKPDLKELSSVYRFVS